MTFSFHITSSMQFPLWGLANKETQNKIQVIQNQAHRKMGFKILHYSFEQLYKDLKACVRYFIKIHYTSDLIT